MSILPPGSAHRRGGSRAVRRAPRFDITAALSSCALLEPLRRAYRGGRFYHRSTPGGRREGLNSTPPRLQGEKLRPLIELDAALEAPEIGIDLARQLRLLEPFGTGNPTPLFCSAGWELRSWRLVGGGKEHLKLNLVRDEHRAAPIFFSAAALEPSLGRGRRFDLAFTLREGSYLDRPSLDMVLKDLRSGDRRTCGRVAVIDRRGTSNRRAALQELLSAGDGEPAVIFAGTGRRIAALKRFLPAEQRLAFLSSGRDNGDRNSALLAECRLLVLYDRPVRAAANPFQKMCR